MPQDDVHIRDLEESDSILELTRVLNQAYAQLADMGLRYVATWQGEDITRRRLEGAECTVAVADGRLVGTLSLHPPDRDLDHPHPHYAREDVAIFHQFGVLPDLQGQGIGGRLLDRAEARARELGAAEIACDTAVPANHLRRFYEKRGYRVVGRANWDMVNYESLILSKALGPREEACTA